MGDCYAGSNKGIGADGTAYGGPKQRTNQGSIGLPVHRPTTQSSRLEGGKQTMHDALRAHENVTFPGLKPKDLVGMPWRVAFALQAYGWWLRSDIIWSKPNPMPESVTDRPTKAHEYLFLLTKSEKYYWDQQAVKEPFEEVSLQRMRQEGVGQWQVGGDKQRDPNYPHADAAGNANRHWKIYTGLADKDKQGELSGRNIRTVWTIATQPFPEAHFATFPEALVEPCIKAGSKTGDVVFDPFAGSGTVGVVALKHGRSFVGLDLQPDYCKMAVKRIEDDAPLFNRKL